jgi:radical SAM-linked protein
MADRETLLRRQDILRRGLRSLRARLSLHDVDGSYLEAALARGGEAMAGVIESAWRRGARFDNWTEHERPDAWAAAFAEAGLSAESLATTPLERDASLPWDVIDGVVAKRFLAEEWDRAERGETTPDCRWDVCPGCGACTGEAAHELVGGTGPASPAPAGARSPVVPERDVTRRSPAGPDRGKAPGAAAPSFRYLLTYAVHGRARFLAHLDTVEVLRRAVRRAGGRLALSAGLRPKPRLAVALPRAVGVEGAAELCEFVLAEPPPPDFARRLAQGVPPGFTVLALEPLAPGRPIAARVCAARYRVRVEAEAPPPAPPAAGAGVPRAAPEDLTVTLSRAAKRYTAEKELLVERVRAGRRRPVDVRRHVDAIAVSVAGQELELSYTATVTPQGTVRPEEVVDVLGRLAGERLVMRCAERLAIILG